MISRLPAVALCLLFWPAVIPAQENGHPDIEIRGVVADADLGNALEFAAISILTTGDSTLVGGGVTDASGAFDIAVEPGTYHIKVEYISYEPLWIPGIDVSAPYRDLGRIGLSIASETLQEVEVIGERSQFQLGLDKRIFNVDKDLISRSGSAADILDNIPSVAVDLEGNVSLRGSQNVRILVDGRPSGLVGLSGNDALRALQGDLVERVEVITNPSARYDAEGMAGIINIILKKERQPGFNGSFSGNVGYPDHYGGSANVNYRKNNVNLFLNYGINYRESPGSGSLMQDYFLEDTTYYLDQTRNRVRSGWSQNVRFGIDMFITDSDILTGSFMYRNGDEENETNLVYRDYDATRTLTSITERQDIEQEDEPNFEYELNYRRNFSREEQTLTAAIQYDDEKETEISEYVESMFNPDYTPSGTPDILERSENREGERSWLAQIDYVHPFAEEGKFEIGYKGEFEDNTNDYLVEEFDDNRWQVKDSLSNQFRYNENIHAAYVILGNKRGSLAWQGGLRMEHSEIGTRLLETEESSQTTYLSLFPTLHLGYELAGDNTVQLSYSRRIRRPHNRYLNPFSSYSDTRNRWSGNPDLQPEFTHSMEIGHIKYWEASSLSSSMYFRHTTGVIERIRTIDDEGNTLSRPENLAERNDYGIEFTFSKDVTEVWKVDGNANFFRSITMGQEFGDSDDYNWQGRLNSRLALFKSVETQVRLNYRGPRETTQGRSKSSFHADIGISKDILKRKATLALNVRDVFNTRKHRYITEGDSFYAEGDFQWRSRQTVLTFTYRLNQKKKRGERDGEGEGFEGGEEFDFQ